MTKLCINCAHHKQMGFLRSHGCLAEGLVDPVDGEQLGTACHFQRSDQGPCGPDGKLFEAKPGSEAA